MDFIAIGDTTVDEFIKLRDAEVHPAPDGIGDVISMRWGDKIPYDFSVLVPAVGNAANAAVSAARLGLSTGFVSNVGDDRYGKEIIDTFEKERVDPRYIRTHERLGTNHDYVLLFDAERTILVKHEDYPYAMPGDLAVPKWFYLSSAGRSEAFHTEVASWVEAHPGTKLAFQPSTFEIAMGADKLARLYAASELVACNKEEAERILGIDAADVKTLLEKMRALGPKTVLITDGPNGGYAYDGSEMLRVPMYPDTKPPVDRTGAGDATTSTIVAALALGLPLREALAWGPVNAMSVVQEIGAQKGLLSRDALEKLLSEAPASYRVGPI